MVQRTVAVAVVILYAYVAAQPGPTFQSTIFDLPAELPSEDYAVLSQMEDLPTQKVPHPLKTKKINKAALNLPAVETTAPAAVQPPPVQPLPAPPALATPAPFTLPTHPTFPPFTLPTHPTFTLPTHPTMAPFTLPGAALPGAPTPPPPPFVLPTHPTIAPFTFPTHPTFAPFTFPTHPTFPPYSPSLPFGSQAPTLLPQAETGQSAQPFVSQTPPQLPQPHTESSLLPFGSQTIPQIPQPQSSQIPQPEPQPQQQFAAQSQLPQTSALPASPAHSQFTFPPHQTIHSHLFQPSGQPQQQYGHSEQPQFGQQQQFQQFQQFGQVQQPQVQPQQQQQFGQQQFVQQQVAPAQYQHPFGQHQFTQQGQNQGQQVQPGQTQLPQQQFQQPFPHHQQVQQQLPQGQQFQQQQGALQQHELPHQHFTQQQQQQGPQQHQLFPQQQNGLPQLHLPLQRPEIPPPAKIGQPQQQQQSFQPSIDSQAQQFTKAATNQQQGVPQQRFEQVVVAGSPVGPAAQLQPLPVPQLPQFLSPINVQVQEKAQLVEPSPLDEKTRSTSAAQVEKVSSSTPNRASLWFKDEFDTSACLKNLTSIADKFSAKFPVYLQKTGKDIALAGLIQQRLIECERKQSAGHWDKVDDLLTKISLSKSEESECRGGLIQERISCVNLFNYSCQFIDKAFIFRLVPARITIQEARQAEAGAEKCRKVVRLVKKRLEG
ncbi:hypothetical protein V3C99_000499 [Haemonchus contortus]